MLQLTPANQVVEVERFWRVEHIRWHFWVEIDPLYEHPEDGGLEAEHEQGQHHVAQPGLALVPGGVSPLIVVDVRLKVEDGGQVEENQGEHEVLVDAETVTLERSETNEDDFI